MGRRAVQVSISSLAAVWNSVSEPRDCLALECGLFRSTNLSWAKSVLSGEKVLETGSSDGCATV